MERFVVALIAEDESEILGFFDGTMAIGLIETFVPDLQKAALFDNRLDARSSMALIQSGNTDREYRVYPVTIHVSLAGKTPPIKSVSPHEDSIVDSAKPVPAIDVAT